MTKKRKKKHNKIIALAKSKLSTIDTLLSSALNDSKISHEEFTDIITEKNICENIKENMKDTAELSALARTAEPSSLERIKEEEEEINDRVEFFRTYGRAEFFRTYDIIKII